MPGDVRFLQTPVGERIACAMDGAGLPAARLELLDGLAMHVHVAGDAAASPPGSWRSPAEPTGRRRPG